MTERTLYILISVVLFALFILQNTDPVAVRFIFWRISMSMALWLALPLILGIAIGALAFRSSRRKSETSKT